MTKPPGIDFIIDGRGELQGTPIPLVEFRKPVSNIMVEKGPNGSPRLIRFFFGQQILEVEKAANAASFAPASTEGYPPPFGFLLKTGELPEGFPAPPDPDPADAIAIAFAEKLKGEKLISVVLYPHCVVIDFRIAALIVFSDRVALAYATPIPATGETATTC